VAIPGHDNLPERTGRALIACSLTGITTVFRGGGRLPVDRPMVPETDVRLLNWTVSSRVSIPNVRANGASPSPAATLGVITTTVHWPGNTFFSPVQPLSCKWESDCCPAPGPEPCMRCGIVIFICVKNNKHMLTLSFSILPELARLLSLLGNEQRLAILQRSRLRRSMPVRSPGSSAYRGLWSRSTSSNSRNSVLRRGRAGRRMSRRTSGGTTGRCRSSWC